MKTVLIVAGFLTLLVAWALALDVYDNLTRGLGFSHAFLASEIGALIAVTIAPMILGFATGWISKGRRNP